MFTLYYICICFILFFYFFITITRIPLYLCLDVGPNCDWELKSLEKFYIRKTKNYYFHKNECEDLFSKASTLILKYSYKEAVFEVPKKK